MATRAKRAKAEPREPNGAIRALIEAHDAMRAKCGSTLGGVGSCFASDLEHDKAICRKTPLQSFVWIVTPNATHMMRIGTDDEALDNTDKASIESTTFKTFLDAVLFDCYDADMLRAGYVRAYVWQPAAFEGTLIAAKHHENGPDALKRELFKLIADQVRSAALDALEIRLKRADEDLILSINGLVPTREQIVKRIERVTEWST